MVKRNFLYDEVLPRVAGISWLVAGLGILFRYFLLRGSTILLMVGLGNLAVVYFLRAFQPVVDDYTPTSSLDYQPVSESPGLLPKFQYIASSLTLIGILFKLLFWSGSAVLLSVGVTTVVLTLSLESAAGRLVVGPILLIAGLGMATWAIPTETFVQTFYRDDPALVEKMLFQQHHPNDKAATAEVSRLLHARHNRQAFF